MTKNQIKILATLGLLGFFAVGAFIYESVKQEIIYEKMIEVEDADRIA